MLTYFLLDFMLNACINSLVLYVKATNLLHILAQLNASDL